MRTAKIKKSVIKQTISNDPVLSSLLIYPQMLPNLITLLAICFGLSAIREAIVGNFALAVGFIGIASILDIFDGLAARKLNAQSPIGAQMDSLADFVDFGVAPAFIIFQFYLQELGYLGWAAALFFALCGGLRLARFNISIGKKPPYWKLFFQGIPAPAGACIMLFPMLIMLWTNGNAIINIWLVFAWTIILGIFMISSYPTYAMKAFSVKPQYRVFIAITILLIIIALIYYVWLTLIILSIFYIASLGLSAWHFQKLKRHYLH